MVRHYPGKSGGLKNCYRGDKTLLLVAAKDSRCSCLILTLLFITKVYCWRTQNISY